MDVAQGEGGDGRVEEVFEEFVGEGDCWFDLVCFVFHVSIVAGRRGGSREKCWSAWILRTGVVIQSIF